MSKKTPFNRIDKIKDTTAKTEIARAHMMVALLGTISTVLLWTLYMSVPIPAMLVVLATILLGLVILFSTGVAYSVVKSRK